jgi:hypothetical protein
MNTTKITGRHIEAGMTIQVCIHTSTDGTVWASLGKQEKGEVLNVERVEYVGGTYRGSMRKVNVSEIVLHTNVGQVHISGRQKVNLLA